MFNLTIVSFDTAFIRLISFTSGGFTHFTVPSFLLVYSPLWVNTPKGFPAVKAF